MGVPFGKYQLIRKIASGGMGEVYLARLKGKEGLEKLVAIKLILESFEGEEDAFALLRSEAKLSAWLSHPNLAQVLEMDVVDGRPFVAMEYVHGQSVSKLIQQGRSVQRPLPPALAVRIAADAAGGLDYAHKAKDPQHRPLNLIHRDVSPQNLLVSYDGAVKLIDFGIAKATVSTQQTKAGLVRGKLAYMAPEQARGEPLDHRVDQFALGIVLYEMLSGAPLFYRDSEVSTLHALVQGEVPELSAIDPALDRIVRRALRPNRDDRFEDTHAFRLALEEWTASTQARSSSAHLAAYVRALFPEESAADPAVEEELRPIFGKLGPRTSATVSIGAIGTLADEAIDPDWAPVGPAMDAEGRLEGGAPKPPARPIEVSSPPEEEGLTLVPPSPLLPPPEAIPMADDAPAEPRRQKGRAIGRAGLYVAFALCATTAGGYLWLHRARAGAAVQKVEEAAGTLGQGLGLGGQVVGNAGIKRSSGSYLRIDSVPPGAEVFVGSESLGVTPYVGDNDFPRGADLTVRLVHRGYQTYTAHFRGGEEAEISARLRR